MVILGVSIAWKAYYDYSETHIVRTGPYIHVDR